MYLSLFIMTLGCIFHLYSGTSLVEFGFLQGETSCRRQSAIRFNIAEKELDFVISPLATALLEAFRCAGGSRLSVVGGARSRMAMVLCGGVIIVMVLHCVLDGMKDSEDVSKGRKRDDIAKTL